MPLLQQSTYPKTRQKTSHRWAYQLGLGLSLGFTLSHGADPSTAKASTSTLCEATIEADDAYRFTPETIVVPRRCQNFNVTLKHVGRLPKLAMGHNWVLSRQADAKGVAKDGAIAGLSNNFVVPGDQRVIASTVIIGAGETAQTSFSVSRLQADEKYAFQCTFGGHSPLMQGSLRLSND